MKRKYSIIKNNSTSIKVKNNSSSISTVKELGLSYDDVLLIPKKSSVNSRKEVSTETRLTKNIKIKIPIVSANMDSVTESEMAIKMAQLGGIGIIHRFNTIQEQVAHVRRVKRYSNAIIENPVTISQDKTLTQAKEIMIKNHVTGLLVVDDYDGELIGILTTRDIRFNPPEQKLVSELMTSKEKLITLEVETKNKEIKNKAFVIEEAKKILIKNKIEKLPLVENRKIVGLITGKDIHRREKYPNASLDHKHRLIVGAAIGVKAEALERAEALVESNVDVLVIDIAHGHSDLVIETLKKLKTRFPNVEVIAGNVATAEGTRDLIEAGADAIKVGIGPGSICTTRIMTGAGYPQLSAVINCSKEADKYNVPVIADGGIKFSGDITKAIAAGTSCVMLGNLLAGTDESPGTAIIKNGKKFKVIRGMASFGAKLGRNISENNSKKENIAEYTPEGVEATVPYRGNVSEVINQLLGGVKSGMSYVGANKIDEIRGKAAFVRITNSGLKESHAHDVNLI